MCYFNRFFLDYSDATPLMVLPRKVFIRRAPSCAIMAGFAREELLKEARTAISSSTGPDQLIIQAVTALEQLEQASNGLVKKGREWFALYNPEAERAAGDHERFLAITADGLPPPGDGSMGALLPEGDRKALEEYLGAVRAMNREREALALYLDQTLRSYAPNVTALAGPIIAAKLLAHAGSLARLASVPSSTLQLFGAETALFRHLRDRLRHRAPKYGVLFNHPLVQKVAAAERGKAARALADKLSLCAKLDRFKGEFLAGAYQAALARRFTEW
jgi:nucleolar protein 56